MSVENKVKQLSACWEQLCAQYLPISLKDSIWRYSRSADSRSPAQGWKLHVSATILNAHKVLRKVAPFLTEKGVQFKAPVSLQEVRKLNSGIEYAYSQVGKVITVYPYDDKQAVLLARQLHKLTRNFKAPSIPFDNRFRVGSNVYYRYGAFKTMELDSGVCKVPALKDQTGRLIPDIYFPGPDVPAWVIDPFVKKLKLNSLQSNPLKHSFRVFRALSQRGKGGVYQAFDLSVKPARLCLIKEGRHVGEVWWDGRDGRSRLRHEERVLFVLRDRGISVPQVYSSFELGDHYYLVTEYIDGQNLLSFLKKQSRRLPIKRVLSLSIALASFMSDLHIAGWTWGDCKPANLILTRNAELRSLDFESAQAIGSKRSGWLTPGFVPVDVHPSKRTSLGDDLYALGAVIYLLLTGGFPSRNVTPHELLTLRRKIPLKLSEIVCELLNQSSRTAVDARMVAEQLSNIYPFL